MATQLDQTHMIHFETVGEPQIVSFPVPEDFSNMDLSSRILYVSDRLKSLESGYPLEKGNLIRRTSLARIEGDKFLYSIVYMTVLENDY
jgi:hypothetical protein